MAITHPKQLQDAEELIQALNIEKNRVEKDIETAHAILGEATKKNADEEARHQRDIAALKTELNNTSGAYARVTEGHRNMVDALDNVRKEHAHHQSKFANASAEHERIVKENDRIIKESEVRDNLSATKHLEANEDRAMAAASLAIAKAHEANFADKIAKINEREASLNSREIEIANREQDHSNQSIVLGERERSINRREEVTEKAQIDLKNNIAAHENIIKERNELHQNMVTSLSEKLADSDRFKKALDDREKNIIMREAELQVRMKEVGYNEKMVKIKETELRIPS